MNKVTTKQVDAAMEEYRRAVCAEGLVVGLYGIQAVLSIIMVQRGYGYFLPITLATTSTLACIGVAGKVREYQSKFRRLVVEWRMGW